MTPSGNNEDNADSLSDDPGEEENRRILNSIESFDDVHKTYKSKSAQQLGSQTKAVENCDTDQQKAKSSSSATCSSSLSSSEGKKGDTKAESDFTSFLKDMSLRYSHFRIESGQGKQEPSQAMNYSNYSLTCQPSCSWQAAVSQEQSPTVGETVTSAVEITQDGGYYTYGPSLPESSSASTETIVNQPTICAAPTAPPPSAEAPSCSLASGCCCCPMQPSEQPPTEYSYQQQQNAYQGQQSMNWPMSVDPTTGMSYYVYPGNGMYPMGLPTMGMNQAQNGGPPPAQYTGEGGNNTTVASPSAQSANGGYDMESFMRKYQQSVQQCYATAQQGLQQTFAQVSAQSQPYFNNYGQGAQPYYVNPSQAPPHLHGGANKGMTSVSGSQHMFESNNQEAQPAPPSFQGMPQAFSSPLGAHAFGSPMGAQQFYSSSTIDAQSYFPQAMSMPSPSMSMPASSLSMPASSFLGTSGGFANDSLQTQTVYSSDYKPYSTEGNHFNHFPNGMGIGLSLETCPGYSPAGTAGLAEMSTGGQVYGMGGGYEMDAGSYPLSHMGYSAPYNFDMPPLAAAYQQTQGVAMVSPNVSNSTPTGSHTPS
ncbi:uncharacterized protein LOC6493690 isoform X2 [Drosophila ananassae]|uniref:uncharacterized protein LOC6493690 isoform X2 n=1 Tax=Drosophila ananassae TaxID=7217 RepID=UPI0013A5C7CE|nr:uncharacterized protein LOC6493690 isoform X2 [Drosophila ananassae]